MTTPTIVKPQKPWQQSPRERISSFALIILAIVTTFVLVDVTPLKGKLAYFIGFFIIFIIIDSVHSFRRHGVPAVKDSIARGVVVVGVTLAVLPIVSILATVFSRGRRGLNLNLLLKDMSINSVNDPITEGGLLHALVGTTILVAIALIISLPIGILTALYLTEINGRLAGIIRFLVQAMSGVPSIVAGLFILSAVVYPITKSYSGIMGSLALVILMIPTIARTSEEVLLLIPNDLREAGIALGGTQWRSVAMVVVPAARTGLITAVILGIARVAGETAPILLLTGGGDKVNFNPLSGPMGSLPFYIWKSFAVGTEESVTRAWAGIFVLLVIVLILFVVARFLSERKMSK